MPIINFRKMNVGDTYKTAALLVSITPKQARNGKSYLELGFSDGESKITAKMWDTTIANFVHQPNTIVDVTINVKEFNGANDYIATEVSTCIDKSLKIEDFVIGIPYDAEVLFNNLIQMVNSSADPRFTHPEVGESTISELTVGILTKYKDDFVRWAAAKSVHHAVYSGLVYHSFRMAYSAYVLATRVYRMVDREMLVCGAALHDIGKLTELNSVLGVADYTPAGRKLGHAYIGMRLIEKEAANGVYNQERIDNLLHMIAAHHGLGEYGALTYPATLEADLLHQIDVIDAHAYQFETELVNTEPGECSVKRIFGLENNTIYRPTCLTDAIIDGVNDPNLFGASKN